MSFTTEQLAKLDAVAGLRRDQARAIGERRDGIAGERERLERERDRRHRPRRLLDHEQRRVVAVDARGEIRGIATGAARQVAATGFGELGLVRIEIATLPGNAASQRVAEKLGATREGEFRNRLVVRGEPVDAVVFSLVPRDLERA